MASGFDARRGVAELGGARHQPPAELRVTLDADAGQIHASQTMQCERMLLLGGRAEPLNGRLDIAAGRILRKHGLGTEPRLRQRYALLGCSNVELVRARGVALDGV